MLTVRFNRMATPEDPRRIDVLIEDDSGAPAPGYVGEISLSTEEFDRAG